MERVEDAALREDEAVVVALAAAEAHRGDVVHLEEEEDSLVVAVVLEAGSVVDVAVAVNAPLPSPNRTLDSCLSCSCLPNLLADRHAASLCARATAFSSSALYCVFCFLACLVLRDHEEANLRLICTKSVYAGPTIRREEIIGKAANA